MNDLFVMLSRDDTVGRVSVMEASERVDVKNQLEAIELSARKIQIKRVAVVYFLE